MRLSPYQKHVLQQAARSEDGRAWSRTKKTLESLGDAGLVEKRHQVGDVLKRAKIRKQVEAKVARVRNMMLADPQRWRLARDILNQAHTLEFDLSWMVWFITDAGRAAVTKS